MSQDIDYEPDVLQFKQVWAQTKLPQQNPPPNKNLQTIQSTTKNGKRKEQNKQNKSQKKNEAVQLKNSGKRNQQKPVNKKSHQNKKPILRNPKQDQNVIEVTTQPQKFYQTSFENQKNNIAKSHLYFDQKNSFNNYENNLQGTLSQFETKKLLQQKDYELSLLRVTNSRNQDRIRVLEKQLESKNEIIAQMRERERKIIQKNCDLQSKDLIFDYGKTQYENFRNDSRRLLRMLQSTAEYKQFANFALDDNGVRFLNLVNKDKKSKLDSSPSNHVQTLHFCTCNKQFIPQSGFWVPQKVYQFGKQFVKSRKGQMTEPQLELLLYELNRIWREREKRIINMYEGMKAHQVAKLKRTIKNIQSKKDNRGTSTKRSFSKNHQDIEQ